jgi:hypothetical protein
VYLGRSLLTGLRPHLEAVKWVFPQKNSLHEISVETSGSAPIQGFTAKLGEIYGSGIDKNNQEILTEDSSSVDEDVLSEIDSVRPGLELEVEVKVSSAQVSLFKIEPKRSNFSTKY